MKRRALLAATLATPAFSNTLHAQEAWPNRSVSVLLGYPPGGVTDFAARGIVDRMSRELGQTLVVDNRPGAATAVANNA
ncbi:MAG: tripartite tricarboxylate transporter substrate binding protein, partial [bacterium]